MKPIQEEDGANEWWQAKSQIKERPFTSQVPLLGGVIAWFRDTWNSVSTKWYVRPLVQQQNEYNRLLAQWIQDYDTRLIEQDRVQVQLAHDAAELTAMIIQMNHLLQSIDQRLARLEDNNSESET
jgi:hypothetical protein